MTHLPITDLPNFGSLTGVAKILAIGWYLHARKGKSTFTADEVRACFREGQFEPPDLSVYIPRLVAKKPPQLVKTKGGYRLGSELFHRLDAKYGQEPSATTVSNLLAKLPEQVPNLSEQDFLRETLACYRIKAYRAATVMAWNLAFDHLCGWIVGDAYRLAAFNVALQARYPKKGPVLARADLEELKESDVIELGRVAKFLPKNLVTILNEKLRRRNMAAHPSSVRIEQHQADDTISDLVNNIVLALV